MLLAQSSDVGAEFWLALAGSAGLAVLGTVVMVAKWSQASAQTMRSPYLFRDDPDAVAGFGRALLPALVGVWSVVLGGSCVELTVRVNEAFSFPLLVAIVLFPLSFLLALSTFLFGRPRFLIPPRLRESGGYFEARRRRTRARPEAGTTN